MKTQSSIEYLSVITAALILLIIILALVGNLILNKHTYTNVPSSCYISPQINCQQIVIANNGIEAKAVVEFTNNLGQTIQFSSNSFQVSPGYAQTSYNGQCFPYNAVPGAEVICNATLGTFNPSLGTQLNPRFQMTYSQCATTTCSTTIATYNAAGTGTTYVSAVTTSLYTVQLIISPAVPNAMITLNGIPYPTNTYVQFIKNAYYTITADPPQGYSFSSWANNGGVTIQNTALQSTTSYADASGVIIATFSAHTTQIAPYVALTLQNGFNNPGTADLANASTTIGTDRIRTVYCATSSITGPCNSAGAVLVTGTGSTSQNVGTLPAGTYSIQACDITYAPTVCSANVVLDQVPSYYLSVLASLTDAGTTAYITGTGTTYYVQGSVEPVSTGDSSAPAGYYYVFNQYTGQCIQSLTGSCPSPTYYTGASNPVSVTLYGNVIETASYTAYYGLALSTACNYEGYGGPSPSCPTGQGAAPSGTGPSGSYLPGTPITVSAPSAAYWQFNDWTQSGGAYSGRSNPGSFSMPSNPAADTANYNLILSITGCSASCPAGDVGSYSWNCYGPNPTCGAATNSCSSYSQYPGGATNTCVACYSLSVIGDGNEAVSVSPSSSGGCPAGEYSSGSTATVTLTPNSGYEQPTTGFIMTGTYNFGPINPGSTSSSNYAVGMTQNTNENAHMVPAATGCYTSGVTIDGFGQCNGISGVYAETGACTDCPGAPCGGFYPVLCHTAGQAGFPGGTEGNDDGDGGSAPYN